MQHLAVAKRRAEFTEDQGHQHAAQKEFGRECGRGRMMEQCRSELPERRVKSDAEQAVTRAIAHCDQPGTEPRPGETGLRAQGVLRTQLPAQAEHHHRQEHAFDHGDQPPGLGVGAPVAQPLPAPARRLAAHAAGDASGQAVEFHWGMRGLSGFQGLAALPAPAGTTRIPPSSASIGDCPTAANAW
ncbi:hypothetical protein GALL_476020 [mine drainage metagenome]|uniref:Uncharacterized protein n=1 Tax=mine drainage metagenome TaxID=410659 RepID=A0A1J5PSS2_9ZZZZ